MRTALFWGTVVAGAFVVGRFIAWPLVKLFHLGEVISHAEAAPIIGTHFSEVQGQAAEHLAAARDGHCATPAKRDLIEAAIAQRSRELGTGALR